MRQLHKDQFAPRWVILIYILSLVEALGLSIYFGAGVTDPEMASMQPEYVDTQQATARLAEEPACGQCLLLARSPHPAALKR